MKLHRGSLRLHRCCVAMMILSSSSSSSSAAAVHGIDVTGLVGTSAGATVLSYDFLMNECMNNDYRDKTVLNPIGPLSSILESSCLPSNGVSDERVRISSQGSSVAALKSLLGTSDYSVELWLQPKINPAAQLSYVSIGVDAVDSTSCSNNFMLSQARSVQQQSSVPATGFLVAVCNQNMISSGNAMTSPSYNIKLADGRAKLMHVVVVMTHSTFLFGSSVVIHEVSANYTVDGISTPQGSSQYFVSSSRSDPSSWDPRGKLNLFPTLGMLSSVNSRPAGNVYYLAMYKKALTFDEITARFNAQFPHSLPEVQNMTVTVQENGEVGDHSLDPGFYSSPIPSDQLVLILLQAYDFDDDPINPNYDRPDRGGPSGTQLYLRDLSGLDGGILYYTNGTELTDHSNVAVPYDEKVQGHAMRYRPPLDKYSIRDEAISSFTFYAVDSATHHESLVDAEVSIRVVHVDKPPTPMPGIAANVAAGVLSSLLLTGNDPDSRIVSARIITIPSRGVLHRIYPNGSIAADAESSTDLIILSAQPFTIAYFYNGGQAAIEGRQDGVVGLDSFEYTLVDAEGRESIPGQYQIIVHTPLTAGPFMESSSDHPLADEGMLCNMTVFGADQSHAARDLYIRILAAPEHGTLYQLNERHELQAVADRLVLTRPLSDGVTEILYRSSADYFTSPSATFDGRPLDRAPDFFDFQVVSLGDGAASTIARQFIHIRNVNQPTQLSFQYRDQYAAEGKVVVYAVGPSSSSDQQHSSKAIIRGFHVLDKDFDAGMIRVRVSTKHGGIVSLNASELSELDFNSDEFCFGGKKSWICQGDGVSDKSMSFVAMPSAAARAINGMTYESLHPNIHDNITVTFFDGEGGDCLSSGQQSAMTFSEGCFTSRADVSVTVLGYLGFDSSSAFNKSNSSLSKRLQYVALALIIIAALAVLRCLYFRCCSCRANPSSSGVKGQAEHQKDKGVQKDIENLSKAVLTLTDNISRLKDRDRGDRDGSAPHSIDSDEMQSERDCDRMKDGGRVRKASKARSKGKPQTSTSSSAASSLPTQTMAMNLDKLLSEARRCDIIGGTSETLKSEVETTFDGSQVLHITVPLKHDGSRGKQSGRGMKEAVMASRKAAAKGRVGGGDPPSPVAWEMHLSKSGRPFFHNNITKQSTWNPPVGLLNVVK